jgi:hypothetical protein
MATMDTKLLANPTDPSAWQQALYAFLAEKERRSGSHRVHAQRTLCAASLGIHRRAVLPDRDSNPDQRLQRPVSGKSYQTCQVESVRQPLVGWARRESCEQPLPRKTIGLCQMA